MPTQELENLILPANTGVILEPLRETDFIFGANKVKPNITLPETDKWFNWFSEGELQAGVYYDTFGCVTFSALNVVEAILNYQIANNMISANNLAWLKEQGYFNDKGQIDLADRFNYKMSNTNPNVGNTGSAVWSSIRHHGVVPEKVWTWNKGRDIPQEQKYVEWFNSDIPQEVKDLGLEFKKRFEIFYEYVPIKRKQIKDALVHSPMQIFIPTSCQYDANKIQQYCNADIGHAVVLIDDIQAETYYPLFDTYIKQANLQGNERFIRKVVPNYKFHPYGYISHIIEKNTMNKLIKGDKRPEVYAIGDDGLLTHIKSMPTLEKGVAKGWWEAFDEAKHTRPQAEVDALPKDTVDVAFTI